MQPGLLLPGRKAQPAHRQQVGQHGGVMESWEKGQDKLVYMDRSPPPEVRERLLAMKIR